MLLFSRTAYAVLLLAALATIFLAYRSKSASEWVQHTLDVRSDTRALLRQLQSAVIQERGYILTGDADYIGPDFTETLSSLPARLDDLKQLVSDNQRQVDWLSKIEPQLDKLTGILRQTVSLVQSGQREEAISVVRSSHVQDLLDDLNADFEQFLKSETGLLAGREANAASLQNFLLLLIGTSLALALGLSVSLEQSTRHFVESLRKRATDLENEMKRRQDIEASLRQAQKMEAVGQLTGGIAHDFNNLLTIIMGNLDTMRRSMNSENAAAEFETRFPRLVDMALQATRNAAKLTHRLLAFARRQPLEPSRIDCNRLVSDMSDLLRRTLGETVDFETVLGGGLWPIFVDPNQLESALLNLAVNSQHAMPNGGHLTIETANTYLDESYTMRFGDLEPGQYVLVSVADTGTGIPTDILDRVFEPFFTTKPAEAGSGLGLAMVHGFVKQSGGHVRIYSEMGHGTTVKMYFPRLEEAHEVAANPTGVPTTAPPAERAHGGETILVVEDNEAVREYASSVLSELGYKVLEAADAKTAFAIAQTDATIDLLFTDVVLPGGVSGRQLSDQVAEIRPGLPVLFTTGYSRNAIIHHGRLDPGVQLIGKPYTQQDLAGKISNILRNGRAARR